MSISRPVPALLAILIAFAVIVPADRAAAEVKNVIFMIGDGAGFNSWHAASMYQGRWDAARDRSTQVYDGPGWIRLACATHPLNLSKTPTGADVQDAKLVYDPVKAWDRESGYRWLLETYTDSAAAGTALATGIKTYNNAINWNDRDRPIMPAIAEIAKRQGRSVGVVTSVQWSHATPAALGGAHVRSRNDYALIANQMIRSGVLDVIMGAGNPDFDDDGRPISEKQDYQYVGGRETWEAIEAARATAEETHFGLRPVSATAEFLALVSGPVPQRVLGTAQVARTLQQSRSGAAPEKAPYVDPLLETVPSLTVMARGALNVLDDNPAGMFLMIEGGAIDWANHDNLGGRMIEEQIEFVQAIEAVAQWVEESSNWDETLLILTADHETGLIWGPNSHEEPFQPIVDRGPGKMPLLRYHADTHSNSLVPLYARGQGSQWLAELADRADPRRGSYADNSDVYHLLVRAVTSPAAVPAAAR